MNRRQWNNVVIWVVSALVLILLLASAPASESWKLQIHYSMTGETVCAHYDFDTEGSCTAAKIWFEEQSAWHGKNTYQCILESQCPAP